jgi:hypothetical protein
MINDHHPHHIQRSVLTCMVILLLVTLSCDLMGSSDTSLQLTKAVLEAQMTMVAQQSSQNTQLTVQAEQQAQIAQSVQATTLALQATQLAQQIQSGGEQPQPVQTQPPVVTEAPPVVTEAPPEQNVDDLIKNAKILLYEDLAGTRVGEIYPPRYVKDALDMGGYTYKDDGSAMGWFKEDLLSTIKWDLIIVAAESHDNIQGEYFEYLIPHLNAGTAMIIEVFYIDDVINGKIAPILSKCGVQFQADWPDPENLALWPLVPDHPVFSYPNSGMSMRKISPFWYYEHGDLLKKGSGGDATMLLGTIATSKYDHATLATCLEGRLILQTFCNLDYARSEITPLWENYIYYTLKNHFTTNP